MNTIGVRLRPCRHDTTRGSRPQLRMWARYTDRPNRAPAEHGRPVGVPTKISHRFRNRQTPVHSSAGRRSLPVRPFRRRHDVREPASYDADAQDTRLDSSGRSHHWLPRGTSGDRCTWRLFASPESPRVRGVPWVRYTRHTVTRARHSIIHWYESSPEVPRLSSWMPTRSCASACVADTTSPARSSGPRPC
jgi:hypothetical protein